MFWLLFVVNWTVIPILISYHRSGYIREQLRWRESLMTNIKWYAAMALFGVAGVTYLWLGHRLNFKEIESLVVAASNAFGLLLVFVCLCPALVSIPRNLSTLVSFTKRLEALEVESGKLICKEEDLMYELENEVKIVYNIGKKSPHQSDKDSSDAIISKVPQILLRKFPTDLESYFPEDLYKDDLKVEDECYAESRRRSVGREEHRHPGTGDEDPERTNSIRRLQERVPANQILQQQQHKSRRIG